MQKALFFLVALLVTVTVEAQFKWLNPQPSGYINSGMTFIDPSHGFMINYNGDLFTTADTGTTWQLKQNLPYARVLKLKDSTGVIGGGAGALYVSTNNGASWTKKDFNSNVAIEWIDITGRDTILLTTTTGVVRELYRSVNRGASWEKMNGTFAFPDRGIDFVTGTIGYSASWNGIYKTVNGGKDWSVVYPIGTSARVTSLCFLDSLTGYAYREIYGMLKTTDGGKNWTTSQLGSARMYDIFIVNQHTAYAAGEDGGAYKTIDGGDNWKWVGAGGLIGGTSFYAQHFFNDSTGLMVGDRGRILKTSNGGATWKAASPTYIDVTALSMGSNTTGYAATWNNLYKTTDAGNTWQPLNLVVGTAYADNSRFDNCLFFSADTGFVTANVRPRLFRTVNGGISFDTIDFYRNNYDNILGISFLDHTTGYLSARKANGYNGILKTIDGGKNWQEVSQAPEGPGTIQFVNERTAYGLQYRTLLRTTDSAKTWQVVMTDYDASFASLYFINAQKGFVAGGQRYLKMTNDSGRTWTSVRPDDLYDDVLKIRFFNETVGYATEEGGKIFKTIDGGLTWRVNGEAAFADCRAIAFASDSTVYIGGGFGAILKASVPQYVIDSLQVNAATPCSIGFSATVTAVMSTVDSVWFEFGSNGFDKSILASPYIVTNGKIKATIPPQYFAPVDKNYAVRVKVLYKGNYYYYNAANTFMAGPGYIPTITLNGNILTSSAANGNQWYNSDVLIPGATNQQYTVTSLGLYSVKVSDGSCISGFSDPLWVNITATIDPVMNNEIKVYPNPVTNRIVISNEKQRRLTIALADFTGKLISSMETGQHTIHIPATRLPAGLYILRITDRQTNKMVTKKFLKVE